MTELNQFHQVVERFLKRKKVYLLIGASVIFRLFKLNPSTYNHYLISKCYWYMMISWMIQIFKSKPLIVHIFRNHICWIWTTKYIYGIRCMSSWITSNATDVIFFWMPKMQFLRNLLCVRKVFTFRPNHCIHIEYFGVARAPPIAGSSYESLAAINSKWVTTMFVIRISNILICVPIKA